MNPKPESDKAQQPKEETESQEQKGTLTKLRHALHAFYQQNEFLILVILAIALARAYPPLGAEYVHPEITATWIAIIFIFLLSGINLPTAEFVDVFGAWKFHIFIQLFSFGISSVIIFGVSRLLYKVDFISIELADGMALVGTLPMTINSAYVLTKCADGDEAAALLNSIMGNMIGIFLSPALLLLYINVKGDIDVGQVFIKLILRVVLPTVAGQILQKTTAILEWMAQHKRFVKQLHQFSMGFIVYTIFCRTFQGEREGKLSQIFLMIAFQLVLLISLMCLAWGSMFWASPKQRVFGIFGCTHKTMAIGILLVDAIFGESPQTGLYALPLLVYHPMQLVLGTMAVPHLAKFVDKKGESSRVIPTRHVSSDVSSASSINDGAAQEDRAASNRETSLKP